MDELNPSNNDPCKEISSSGMTMTTTFSLPAGGNESFVLLANGAKGMAAIALVHQALEAPNVFVFGELLDHPNISSLTNLNDAKAKSYLELLNIFAYGTYKDYQNSKSLIELTPPMKLKLRLLTLATLATQQTLLPYSVLQKELEIENVRQLEDLVIEGVSSHVVLGKLDQQSAHFEVDSVMARDMKKSELSSVISTLTNWCDYCDNMLSSLETEGCRANEDKKKNFEHKASVEEKAAQIYNEVIKGNSQFANYSSTNDPNQDDADTMDTSEYRLDRKEKKTHKTKGIRGSGAKSTFWPNR